MFCGMCDYRSSMVVGDSCTSWYILSCEASQPLNSWPGGVGDVHVFVGVSVGWMLVTDLIRGYAEGDTLLDVS